MEGIEGMKKSFKTSVCKAITTVACAAFVFAGALTFNSITAKADTTNFTIDLSNGKCVQFTQDELDLRNLPQSYKETVAAGLVMEIYDPNLKEFPGIGTTKSVVSQNPYQGICIEQPEGGNVKMVMLFQHHLFRVQKLRTTELNIA